jgi:rod shape-determining protein MreD
MILPRGQQLLLPANPWFMAASLLVGLVVNLLQNMGFLGNAAWAPDVLLVILVFWCVHQPTRVGVFTCFALGLVVDVHQTALLGQHALSFSVMGFLALQLHRRMQWFTGASQAPQILPIFLIGMAVDVSLRYLFGRSLAHWSIVFAPLLEAALWAPISFVLLIPQRRAPDPDENRPL